MPTKPKGSGGGNTRPPGRPSQAHGNINAGKGVSSAQQAIAAAAQAGRPRGVAGQTTTPANIPTTTTKPPVPVTPTTPSSLPPKRDDIHLNDTAKQHILDGDGGRQGGHLAGTGFSNKTEFPVGWDGPKILDAAYQVTQTGKVMRGPYPTKDADGNIRHAYDYEGKVDGVTVKTTVFADNGEIRTAYPPNPSEPGVIHNPPAPVPPPAGIPQSEPPRYSNPAAGGDGSWTWEGPKGDRIIRVVQDAQGNVTTSDLGPYQKKR